MTMPVLGFIALSLLGILFVVWPLLRGWRTSRQVAVAEVDRQAENVALYRDHLTELEQSKADGRIDSEQFEQLKGELDRNLLEEVPAMNAGQGVDTPRSRRLVVGILVVVALLLPLSSWMFYNELGADDAIALVAIQEQLSQLGHDTRAAQQQGAANAEALGKKLLELQQEYVQRLRQHLSKHPDDVQNWYLLARREMMLQNYPAAVSAYEQILKQDPQAVQIMAEQAQALFLANGNRVTEPVMALVSKTLQQDAQNVTALGLAGIGAFETEEYAQAIDFWQRAIAGMGPDSAGALALKSGIERAKNLLGDAGEAVANAEGAEESSQVDADGASVVVNVALADGVAVDSNDTVFVYARAWQGPKMPLAIAKIRVADLPTQITLTEAMAMMPRMTIATVPQLELVARVSKDGSPQTRPGDWQAAKGPVVLKDLTGPVPLVISSQVQ